ncbi:MAG: radical SAM/Cys-rich domain protein [Firmicutes bacterium]|nr:radical SAM/Cys-rich domain protein [Bacillota bacterium]
MQSFHEYVKKAGQSLVKDELRLLQVNLGYKCNLSCRHCHIEAGPKRQELMSLPVIEDCIRFIARAGITEVDITGGAPEVNPELPDFIRLLRQQGLVSRIILRTNLAILDSDEYEHLPEFFARNNVELIASMPCYLEENVEFQRGSGVYQKNIAVLKMLNCLGYGKDNLKLHLVYNPGNGFLPEQQSELERAYKESLGKKHGITFNSLYTITNAPIGRFRSQLEKQGELEGYMKVLVDNSNSANLEKVMCRSMVSVDWLGRLFDCDFNQALNMPLVLQDNYIGDICPEDLLNQPIELGSHCFSCIAGSGSSCQGSLVGKAG